MKKCWTKMKKCCLLQISIWYNFINNKKRKKCPSIRHFWNRYFFINSSKRMLLDSLVLWNSDPPPIECLILYSTGSCLADERHSQFSYCDLFSKPATLLLEVICSRRHSGGQMKFKWFKFDETCGWGSGWAAATEYLRRALARPVLHCNSSRQIHVDN